MKSTSSVLYLLPAIYSTYCPHSSYRSHYISTIFMHYTRAEDHIMPSAARSSRFGFIYYMFCMSRALLLLLLSVLLLLLVAVLALLCVVGCAVAAVVVVGEMPQMSLSLISRDSIALHAVVRLGRWGAVCYFLFVSMFQRETVVSR